MSRRKVRLSHITPALTRFDTLEPRLFLSVSAHSSADISAVTFRGVTADAVTGSYNVSVKPGADFIRLAANAAISNITDLGRGIYNFSTTWSPSKVSSWARQHTSTVSAISPNYVHKTAAVPNDPLYANNQFSLNNTGQLNPNPVNVPVPTDPRIFGTPGEDIDAQAAWNITTGSSNVVIAVLDSGLDLDHPDIAPNVYANPGETPNDGIDNDGNGFVDDTNGWDFFDDDNVLTDFIGHGTWVSGVIAGAGNNGIGVSGVSWNSKILPIKVFADNDDSGTTNAITLRAVNYIVDLKLRGVNIAAMNLSLGGFGFALDPVFARAISVAKDNGIVFVAAAGNDSTNIDRNVVNPAREGFKANSLVVAATTNTGALSDFSNFGNTTVQVAAPGTEIFTTHSSDTIGDAGSFTDPVNGGQYNSVSGTSFSAPIVAGIVALAKSAFPNATPDEIISAIINGTDRLDSLNGATERAPKKVSSGGRVNAFKTLQLLSSKVVGTNTVSSGDWRGRFGAAANFIYGATTGTPTFPGLTSSLTPSPATVVETRVRAGSTAGALFPEGSQRSNSFLSSTDPISFNFDFTTLGARRLTLYFADLDRRNRAQDVRVINTDTGLLLSSTSISKFQNGTYLSLDLSGKVTVEIVPTRGQAALNALFLDTLPTNSTALRSVDTLTSGNWINTYGDRGQLLPGQTRDIPAFATVSTNATVVFSRSTRDAVLPESLSSTRDRSAGAYSDLSGSPFDITVNVTGGAREVSFYTAQAARTPRIQRFQVIDPTNGNIVAQQDVTVSRSGAYVTFSLTGNNTVRVHTLGGGAASVAGIFFNSSKQAAGTSGNTANFDGINSTLGGRWRGSFGSSGQFVVGASTAFPSFISSSPTPSNGTVTIVNPNTSNRAAPQNPNLITSGGIVGFIQTTTTSDLPITISDGSTRRLSAYFTDFDRQSRVQKVEIVNPTTGEVLSSQILRQFERGKYLSWEITGNVALRLTRISGPNAVVSAVFFD